MTNTDVNRTRPGTDDRQSHSHCEGRLRIVLRANALSSSISGLTLAAAPDAMADVLDVSRPGWIRVLGLALLSFAAFVAWVSTSELDQLRRHAPGIVVGDLGWVMASIATVALGWYSGVGIAIVVVMAACVDTFAILQWRAWRRIRD